MRWLEQGWLALHLLQWNRQYLVLVQYEHEGDGSDHKLGGDDLHLVIVEHLTRVKWMKVLTTRSSQYMVSSSMAGDKSADDSPRYSPDGDRSGFFHSCPAWVVKLPPGKKVSSVFEWQALKNFSLNLNHNCGFRLLIRYQKPIDNTVYLSTNLYNIYSTIFQRSSLSLASLKKNWCLRLVVSRKKKNNCFSRSKNGSQLFFSGETIPNGRSEARHFIDALEGERSSSWNQRGIRDKLSMVWPQAVVQFERLVFDSRNDVVSDQRHKTPNVWRYAPHDKSSNSSQ